MASASGANDTVSAAVKKAKLKMDSVENGLWLVKVPAFMAEKLVDSEYGDTVAQLHISMDPKTQKKITNLSFDFRGDETVGAASSLDFTLETLSANPDQQLLVFNYNSEEKDFALQASISKSLLLKPKDSLQYRAIIKERGVQSTPSNGTVMIDQDVVDRAATESRLVDFIPPAHAEMKKKRAENARSRRSGGGGSEELDSDLLRSKVFQCFENNSRQALKDLLTFCKDVPGCREKDIRDLLNEYATYQSKGIYKGFYELKPEFQGKTSKEGESAAAKAVDTKKRYRDE